MGFDFTQEDVKNVKDIAKEYCPWFRPEVLDDAFKDYERSEHKDEFRDIFRGEDFNND